eukprot:scaffold10032_cov123-Isochrysis_galbana.AAC.2
MSHNLAAAARREPEGLLTGVLGVQELGHAEGVCARQKGGTSVLHQSLIQCLRIRECNTRLGPRALIVIARQTRAATFFYTRAW